MSPCVRISESNNVFFPIFTKFQKNFDQILSQIIFFFQFFQFLRNFKKFLIKNFGKFFEKKLEIFIFCKNWKKNTVNAELNSDRDESGYGEGMKASSSAESNQPPPSIPSIRPNPVHFAIAIAIENVLI